MSMSFWYICEFFLGRGASFFTSYSPVTHSFIFTLQEFATELVSLVDAMARIYNQEQARVHRPPWWKRMFKGLRHRLSGLGRSSTSSRDDRKKRKRPGLKRTLCTSSYPLSDSIHWRLTF